MEPGFGFSILQHQVMSLLPIFHRRMQTKTNNTLKLHTLADEHVSSRSLYITDMRHSLWPVIFMNTFLSRVYPECLLWLHYSATSCLLSATVLSQPKWCAPVPLFCIFSTPLNVLLHVLP